MFGRLMKIDLQEREVAALERIAAALERMAGPDIPDRPKRQAVLTQVTEEELWEQEQREQEMLDSGLPSPK